MDIKRLIKKTKIKVLFIVIVSALANSFCAQVSAIGEEKFVSNPIPYFKAEYDANIQGFSVTATREYKSISKNISELSFKADSFIASLEENSQFTWEDQQIKPFRFTHKRTIFGQSKRQTLSFDWDKNKITSTNKGKTRVFDNNEAALDHLSFQLQLQNDLRSNDIENKIYRIADRKRIREYSFNIVGEEILETPLGKFNTIKVIVDREKKDRKTYIWLAKDWHHLLVKLEQHEDDDEQFSLQIKSASINGKKVSGL